MDAFIIDTSKSFNVSSLAPEQIRAMAKKLRLDFVHGNESETNVCYANIEGLRPEFRQTFTVSDLTNYVRAMLQSGLCKPVGGSTLVSIPYPADADSFWKVVEE